MSNPSVIIPNEDDYIDNSQWEEYYKTHAVDWNSAMCRKAIADIQEGLDKLDKGDK